jgi:hypothetical protein
MRPLLLLSIVTSCAIAALAVYGQDVPLPKSEPQDPAATPPPELIPADILPPPDPAAPPMTLDIPTIDQLDEGLKPPPLSPAAEAHRLHIEWRKLRNRAQNDPRVKAAFADADAARTDLERRRLLARYVEILHARMIAMAPEMKKYLLDRKREQLAALPQPRTRPETALKPEPTPKPAPGASPGASPTASPSPTPSVSAVDYYASPSPSPSGSSLMPRIPRP